MPRLFTALEIPADLGLRLSMLRGGLPGAVWISPEFYHITLRFIGDIDDRRADDVADELARIHRRGFEVSIRGVDSFGNGKPHSVFAAVQPSKALTDLQAEQERMMQRLGLDPEGRRYTPHVTIARCKGASGIEVARWLDSRGDFPGGSFRPARFVLYSSKSSTGGGPYVVEDAYPFDP
ncbi:MAG: RNA 2',3'-cyclic phosphodiesterase [Hyphomicrobiaceae bacterium]|nr:RNA 2',3'-cyclic phosphodiesterase [Hyphomicrobiaceae bacterium]